jgi:hypothetical protein
MNAAESEPVTAQAARRWYQCSSRTLALLVLIGTMVCLPVAVVAHNSKRRSDRQGMSPIPGRIVSGRERFMSLARFDDPIPADGFGIDLRFADDGSLANLKSITKSITVSPIRTLNLDSSMLTDAGMKELVGFHDLVSLDLDRTAVTDSGLQHVATFSQLRWLSLHGTQITDAGLEHLKDLSQLEMIGLSGTRVTEQGLKEFQRTRPKCKIWF